MEHRFAAPFLLALLAFACGGTTEIAGAPDSGSQYCGPDTVWCNGECVATEVASEVCSRGGASSSGGASGSGSGVGPGGSGGSGGSSGSSGGGSGSSSGGTTSGKGVPALGYKVIDAAYSRAADKVVIVTDTGNAVHLVDPHTLNDVSMALPTTPASLAVSPDGLHAAVGHDGFISYVDLLRQSVAHTWNVPAPFGDVALSDAYVYGFPSSDQWVSLYTVQASTGAVTTSNSIYAGMRGAVSPDGTMLFAADTGLSPESLYAYSLTNPAQPVPGPMYFGDMQSPCGALWISKDGTRLYTRCGSVFDANGLAYFGDLSSADQNVADVDDWSADGSVAVLAGKAASQQPGYPAVGALQLQIYAPEFLALKTTVDLPPIATPSGDATSDGRFVFHDAAGTSTFAIIHGSAPTSQVEVFALAKLQ